MYTEVTFSSDPYQIIRYISLLGINIEAQLINEPTRDYRVVIADKSIPIISRYLTRENQSYKLSPVIIIPFDRVIMNMKEMIASSESIYLAENNRMVYKLNYIH